MRLKLTVAYDGRPYGGWQIQPNADTIQERIERALEAIAKQPIRLHGSGRTDAGVHAAGQVAHFDAPDGLAMNPANWLPALNSLLPATIRIMHCEEAGPGFHARFSAVRKTYRYRLATAPVLPPLEAGLAWHLPQQLDSATLARALAVLRGRHDFRAFAANRGDERPDTNFVRNLEQASLATLGAGFELTFTADGFLYRMARLLTGAAVQAAQGRLPLDDLAALLDQPPDLPRGKSPHCAPPGGLTLWEVHYYDASEWRMSSADSM